MTAGGFSLPLASGRDSEDDDYDNDYDNEYDYDHVHDFGAGGERGEFADGENNDNDNDNDNGNDHDHDQPNGLGLGRVDSLEHADAESGTLRATTGAGPRRRTVEWVGKPSVVGPEWMRMPLLTVGMLGLQCVWSIEMAFASPYLLELGLSKSLMSLVFVAGPLSGLIVQPLIGIFADRSRSRFGRRRPFMLAGCAISVVAMMLLGWVREIAHFFGGGSTMAIWLAVWAIYLIDFSINAVQAADRALVVDTLPPSQQEKGNAWAGRMFGTGSLAGFFVGNINLVSILPFLGTTQLQVLSFLTSVLLMATHGLTAYSVKERVLLRDNRRGSSSTSFSATLKSIWTNIFTLPPAIRSICYAQFFAWIGWFPVLFYTSVWVGEIYVKEALAGGRSADDPDLQGEATRAGSRALFLNACVNLFTSIFFPFLVSHSGIRRLDDSPKPTRDSTRPAGSSREGSSRSDNLWSKVQHHWDRITVNQRIPQRFQIQLPIPGFTLIRAWMLGQIVFFLTMMATYFARSVATANIVIAINGFCWAVAQWAPYSLLGEWILLDTSSSSKSGRHTPIPQIHSSGEAIEMQESSRLSMSLAEHEDERALMKSADIIEEDEEVHESPQRLVNAGHSRTGSSSALALSSSVSTPHNRTPSGSKHGSRENLNRLVTQGQRTPDRISFDRPNHRTISPSPLHHSRSDDSLQGLMDTSDSASMRTIPIDTTPNDDDGGGGIRIAINDGSDDATRRGIRRRNHRPRKEAGNSGQNTAEKAGVILGIHNIFIVLPQFLVTFLSSVIFFLLEPTRPALPEGHPGPNVPVLANVTAAADIETSDTLVNITQKVVRALERELDAHVTSSTDSVGLIFRIGGVSAAIAGYLCWRMSREWAAQDR